MGRDIQHGLNFPLLRELVYDLGADYIGMAHDCLIPFRVELLLDPHHTGRCNAGHRQGYDRLSLRHLHGCLRLRHADDSAAAGGEHGMVMEFRPQISAMEGIIAMSRFPT